MQSIAVKKKLHICDKYPSVQNTCVFWFCCKQNSNNYTIKYLFTLYNYYVCNLKKNTGKYRCFCYETWSKSTKYSLIK